MTRRARVHDGATGGPHGLLHHPTTRPAKPPHTRPGAKTTAMRKASLPTTSTLCRTPSFMRRQSPGVQSSTP